MIHILRILIRSWMLAALLGFMAVVWQQMLKVYPIRLHKRRIPPPPPPIANVSAGREFPPRAAHSPKSSIRVASRQTYEVWQPRPISTLTNAAYEDDLKDLTESAKGRHDRAQSLDGVNVGVAVSLHSNPHVKHSKQALSKRKQMHILNEILSTEQAYVSFMECALTLYGDALKSIMKPHKYERLFGNLAQIYEYHRRAVLPDIRQLILTEDADMRQDMGTLISRHLLRWRTMYPPYIHNFDAAQAQLDLISGNKKFILVAIDARSDPRHTLPNLQYYLIMPVQRLPRYKLLLEDLQRTMTESEDSYSFQKQQCITNLQRAVDGIVELTTEIDKTQPQVKPTQLVLGKITQKR